MGDAGAAGCLEALVLGLGGLADAPGGAEELDVLRCFGCGEAALLRPPAMQAAR